MKKPKETGEDVASQASAVTTSPVTPSPPTMASRVGVSRPPDRAFDIRAAIKQQEMTRDLPLPSLTTAQISYCEEALKQLKQKMSSSGARSWVDREFNTLQGEQAHNYKALAQTKVAVAGANRVKNRYIDVLPCILNAECLLRPPSLVVWSMPKDDNTRVVLDTKNSDPPSSDYINASYIQDNVREDLPRYIATQGPLTTTVNDLWRMVLQQQCPVIIMLTRLVDGNHDLTSVLEAGYLTSLLTVLCRVGKCAHYFPAKAYQSQTFGQIVVTNKSLSCSQHSIARRIFEVQDIKSQEPPLTVVHYEYLDWPDRFVPPSTRPVRELIRALFKIPPQAGPFVVHCSAGIGRSGTYCTIDHTLRRILAGDLTAVDIENTVRQFRLLRDGMVQTREQYRFCYEAVAQELQDYISTRVRPESTVKL